MCLEGVQGDKWIYGSVSRYFQVKVSFQTDM